MSMYTVYPLYLIVLRRLGAVLLGVLAFPVMIFMKDRSRFYSYLHRVWAKTSNKPVWLKQSEKVVRDFY